jgi:MFS family permease
LLSRFADNIGANRVVLALSVARLGDAMGNSILFIIIPLYVAYLPAPSFPIPESVRVGILISLYGLVNSAIQPLMGALSDRLSRRKLLIEIGLAAMGLATFLFLFASHFADLLAFRALQGVGVALTVPASMALMATATRKTTRGGSMGVYTTMRMVGFAAGPLVGGALYDSFGFVPPILAGTACIVVGLVLVQIWVKEVPANVRAPATRRFRILDRELLSVGIVGLAVATFVMAAAFSMMGALETQFNARLNETAFAFSIAFSALMVSRLLFQIPLGRLSDRIGRKPFIIIGLIFMAPVTALLGVVTSTSQLVGLRLLQGLASAAVAAPAFAAAADLARAGGEGRQMSIITMGFGLGIALGPLVAGLLAVSSFELPFIIGGVLSLAGAWVVFHYVPESVQPEALPATSLQGQESTADDD